MLFWFCFPKFVIPRSITVLLAVFIVASLDCDDKLQCVKASRKLSIVFTEKLLEFLPEQTAWNGRTVRETRGISGTHTANIFLAEGFAARGHHVHFIADTINSTQYKGVNYVHTSMVNRINCDILITTFSFRDLSVFNGIEMNFKKVIMILNNDPVGISDVAAFMLTLPREKFAFAHVSEFGKLNIMYDDQWMELFENKLFHNSIDIDEIPLPIDLSLKQKRFAFFPCLDRGSEIAFFVAKHFPDFQFHTMTYFMSYKEETVPEFAKYFGEDPHNQLHFLTNSGKTSVYEVLKTAKYFVYPLVYAKTFQIHYDTFAYVILEALLHGVVVIAPPIAVYKELYGDAIAYVDIEDILPSNEYMYTWRQDFPASWELLNAYSQRFVQKVVELENNPALYLSHVEKGIQLREKFSNHKIAREMEEYLYEEVDKIDRMTNNRRNFYTYHKNPYSTDLKTPHNATVRGRLRHLQASTQQPKAMEDQLRAWKDGGLEPKVIYDIGCNLVSWTRLAKSIWPEARIIMFDAFEAAEFLYQESGYEYHIGVLSDEDDKEVKFYENVMYPEGNSYYREIGSVDATFFPIDEYRVVRSRRLDSVVKERGLPLPDLVKIDVQGAEKDILTGGWSIINQAERLIVEMQHVEYNDGAPKVFDTLPWIEDHGWDCDVPMFSSNDYGFVRKFPSTVSGNEDEDNEFDVES